MNDMTTPSATVDGTATSPSREQLMSDLRGVVADAEALMRSTAAGATASAAQLRDRLQDRLREARHDLRDLQENSVAKAKAASRAADDYVHENPWRSIGIAAGAGLVIGMLIGRR